MSGCVLVIMEQRGGEWNRMSFETLAAGQKLGAELGQAVSAAIPGRGVAALASELATKKLDRVYVVEHERLGDYTADGYTAALEQLIRKVQPWFVLFPHTYQVRDLAPKLTVQPGADLGCHRHAQRGWAGVCAAAFSGQAECRCEALRLGAVFCFHPSRRL